MLLGGSVLSIVELLDFCIYNGYLRHHKGRSSEDNGDVEAERAQDTKSPADPGVSFNGKEAFVISPGDGSYG